MATNSAAAVQPPGEKRWRVCPSGTLPGWTLESATASFDDLAVYK